MQNPSTKADREPPDPVFTLEEAAKFLKVSVKTVRRNLNAGRISASRVTLGRKRGIWRFTLAQLQDFLRKAEVPRSLLPPVPWLVVKERRRKKTKPLPFVLPEETPPADTNTKREPT
jgi:excisionase family DNA binding protein